MKAMLHIEFCNQQGLPNLETIHIFCIFVYCLSLVFKKCLSLNCTISGCGAQRIMAKERTKMFIFVYQKNTGRMQH